jgi:hypothetical protein
MLVILIMGLTQVRGVLVGIAHGITHDGRLVRLRPFPP